MVEVIKAIVILLNTLFGAYPPELKLSKDPVTMRCYANFYKDSGVAWVNIIDGTNNVFVDASGRIAPNIVIDPPHTQYEQEPDLKFEVKCQR